MIKDILGFYIYVLMIQCCRKNVEMLLVIYLP